MYRKHSRYHRISVTEYGGVRSLKFDGRRQSALDMSDGYTSDIAYTDYLHTALALRPDAGDTLILGLGGGALPKRMWRDYPWMRVDAVEIDPEVVDVAVRFFGLPEDPRLRVFIGDGRQFVASTKHLYDIVVVDTYSADAIPFHLATAEFFREVRRALLPGGVLAYNVIGSLDGPWSALFRRFHATVSDVWPNVHVFAVGLDADGTKRAVRNIVVLATDARVPEDVLLSRIRERVGGRVSVRGFERFGDDLYADPIGARDASAIVDAEAPRDGMLRIP